MSPNARLPFPQSLPDFTCLFPDDAACILPHPSGLCRLWNEPGSVDRARAAVATALGKLRQ